ncbi:hypothetical protein [Hansschlegelia zhihuaiae]|uniref:Type II secretion system protein GspC N-terminal domain-containing protein n=1 Tax=Hansschlegelia zhihuaiae TaxID=405005 RepID=A0A4Q0MB82_9HYPH|nr:hypothetical protein [Hansschlegelia zhihuaiae]RXF70293.1 hypothetical protein EK403_17220 [Hansschlegelia zhihuaiae]
MRAALIAVALALGAATALAGPSGGPVDEAADAAEDSGAAPSPETLALNPLAALDKGSLTGFRDMPLFTPSRRRPEPPPPVAEAPPPPPPPPPARKPSPPPELKLAGVVEGPEGSIAVVENTGGGGKIERLRLGDQVGGWLVTAIDASTLKLTLDEREEQYRMFERTEPSAASADEETPDLDVDGAPPRRPKPPRQSNRATQPDDEDEDQ